jgi:hypothetical protein
LATTWKQDFKLNFVNSLEHLHFGVTIPFVDNLYPQNPGTDLELLVPIEKRVKRACHPIKSVNTDPICISLPFLGIRLTGIFTGTVVLSCLEQPVVIEPVDWSKQGHTCGGSLRLEVNREYSLRWGGTG